MSSYDFPQRLVGEGSADRELRKLRRARGRAEERGDEVAKRYLASRLDRAIAAIQTARIQALSRANNDRLDIPTYSWER